ncbi:MAG: hypothetical protein QW727_03185 [Candidatus Pacearchaeota archaeon]
MNLNQFVEKILNSKKYRNYQKNFVKKIVLKNLNRQDCLKSSKQMIHEVSLMFKGLNRVKDIEMIWKFFIKKTNQKKDKLNVLDLGAGKDWEFFKFIVNVDYTGVDISLEKNIIQDDILSSKKPWTKKDYDVVLMLNLIPVLEKIEKNSGIKLVEHWLEKSKYVVLSFPLYSIGRKKYIGNFWKSYIEQKIKKDYDIVGSEIVVILNGRK